MLDPAEAIAELLTEMTKGQHLLLVEAIKGAGGEIKVDWDGLLAALDEPSQTLVVDAEDGPIMIRLGESAR